MYYTVKDATYWYEVYGEGVPVVLLHGFTGSTATWSEFISNWKEQFQIIVVDLPGHGKTKTQSPRTMEACCADLNQLFTSLQLDSIHLAGYSMGGRTALSFAMLYPERIASLTLESASPGLASEAERQERIENDEKLAQRIEQDGIMKFVDFWENIALFDTQKKLPAAVRQAIRDERTGQSADGLTQSLRHMGTGKQPSWWGQLNAFKKPVLLLAGTEDKKFVGINKKMENQLQTSKFVSVKNAGHAIHVEQPEIFGKLVSEFICNII
ncbi:MAG TPA: 2-succinyl-6-hydroxy-2,4-cyclohexadiene-1-carboxylate synthase [Virgibacillus sp.]|nr:2-succinyl-6-hydroxy-2,4-cyclohexadiene-1-carboxylate synthase [Virgibacillus sp.]